MADAQGHLKDITDPQDTPLPLPVQEAVSVIKFSPDPQRYQCYNQFGQQLMAVAQWDGTISVWSIGTKPALMGAKPTG
jgi:hypothetical protein